MKSLPNISVVMCTYNGEKYLSEQLDSILGQSLPPYEVIVQDDGSSDHTWTILQSYASRFPVVKLFRNEAEHGINGNFFSAMRRASGHLLAVSDQDDVWHPDKLKEQAAAIGNKLMCICRSEPFCQQGKERKLLPYDRRRPSCNLVRMLYTGFSGHCLLFRRQLLDLVPPSGPIYRQTWYDVILSQTQLPMIVWCCLTSSWPCGDVTTRQPVSSHVMTVNSGVWPMRSICCGLAGPIGTR